MFLSKISYSEYENEGRAWKLEEIDLEDVNLLVGKNATGKTRTINVINGLGNLLAGLQAAIFDSGTYYAEFITDDSVYKYYLQFIKGKINYEKLLINDEMQFERNNDGVGKIFAYKINIEIDFQVPQNQLVAVSRRDAIQHPYLENLYSWAKGIKYYAFGSELGKDTGVLVNDINNVAVNPRDANQVTGLFLNGIKEYGSAFSESIVTAMKMIGYDISEVNVNPNPNVSIQGPSGIPIYMLNVKETDRDAVVFQNEMSQGMFRVLSLLVQIVYSEFVKNTTTVMIDDIGEGLDYDRSTKIIQLLTTKASEDKFQLIMSTNDKFVMNCVPLKYWQVIQRHGSLCKVFNYRNSKLTFDDFEFTGLSNFDFLSTDFYSKGFDDK
jgi:hypothetical protein